MFAHYLGLALRSLRRNPIFTALMVLAIGLGIGASMTMITVLHVLSDDPLPGRSGQLYRPYLNPLPANYKPSAFGPDPSINFTWPDAMALLAGGKAAEQAVMAGGSLTVRSNVPGVAPSTMDGRYTTRDFFAMFGVPFLQGAAWTQADEAGRAQVVVLTQSLAKRLFGQRPAIGGIASLGGHDFQVVGVIAEWHPRPLFYADQSSNMYSAADQFFLPLATSMALHLSVSGSVSGWSGNDGSSSQFTSPNTSWLQMWVKLKSHQVAAYRQFLHNYAARQHALGRFGQPPQSARLYGLMTWLSHEHLVPDDVLLQAWLALGFLFVCMLNIVALLLAKYLRRSGEISVRRALGARRWDIFVQFGVESALVGLAGGTVGLAIAELGLWSVRQRPDDYAKLAQLDPVMLLSTFAMAIAATVVAGLLPAWRACRVAPALQLKTL